jgi:hypothetical protein
MTVKIFSSLVAVVDATAIMYLHFSVVNFNKINRSIFQCFSACRCNDDKRDEKQLDFESCSLDAVSFS